MSKFPTMSVAERIANLESEIIYLRQIIESHNGSDIRELASQLKDKLISRLNTLKST